MAVDSYDATTGRPIFLDTGAPDIGVDPTEVGKYAADVGNRIIRADLAALDLYAYKRQGLGGHALDTKVNYVHDGTGWVPVSGGGTVTLTAFGANWNATSGYEPFLVVDGEWRELIGAASRLAGGSLATILTIPTGHRPTGNQFLGAHITSTGTFYELHLNSSGVLSVPTGYGNSTAPGAYPLRSRWRVS